MPHFTTEGSMCGPKHRLPLITAAGIKIVGVGEMGATSASTSSSADV